MKNLSCIVLASLFLFGCDNVKPNTNNALLEEVRSYYTENVHDKDQQICFYLGDVTFPYQEQFLTYPAQPRLDVWVNNELNRRLALFTELSLLEKYTDENSPSKFDLTDEGRTYFKDDKFCFGQINILHVQLPTSGAANTSIRIEARFENIPEWVKSEAFQHYFYRYNGTNNYINIYPDLKRSLSKFFSLSVSKLRDGSYIIDDKKDIMKIIPSSYHPDKSLKAQQSLAYYDTAIAKRLVKDFLWLKRLPVYWGEPDPIIMTPVSLSPTIALANNHILLPEQTEQLVSKHHIHTIEATTTKEEPKTLLGAPKKPEEGTITITFDKDGSLNQYSALYQNRSGTMTITQTKNADLENDSVVWVFDQVSDYDWLTSSKIVTFAADTRSRSSGSIRYYTDVEKRITSVSSSFFAEDNYIVEPEYDEHQRLVKYWNKQLTYQGNKLVQISSTEKKIDFAYDDQERLIASTTYINKNGKFDKSIVCNYSVHNAFGDWTKSTCGNEIVNRTITYYDE